MIQNPGQEEIADYNNRFIDENGFVDLSDVSDNECTEIVLQDVLNQVPMDTVVAFMSAFAQKLRKGGTLSVNGLDLRMFCRRVLKNDIDDKTFNAVTNSNKSIISIPSLKQIVAQSGLVVERLRINGDKYECVTTR